MVFAPIAGIRLSTLALLAVFGVLGLKREDRRFWFAAAAWLGGFEVVYQIASVMTHPLPAWTWAPFVLIGIGSTLVVVATVRGVRPSLPLMTLSGIAWAVWLASGFHVNGHTASGFNGSAEIMNEAAKILWGLAYLVPLLPKGSGEDALAKRRMSRRRAMIRQTL
jgi:hypothetical protein